MPCHLHLLRLLLCQARHPLPHSSPPKQRSLSREGAGATQPPSASPASHSSCLWSRDGHHACLKLLPSAREPTPIYRHCFHRNMGPEFQTGFTTLLSTTSHKSETFLFLFFLSFFFFLYACPTAAPRHMEVLGQGSDLSRSCDHQVWQRWILNPLCQAGEGTCLPGLQRCY